MRCRGLPFFNKLAIGSFLVVISLSLAIIPAALAETPTFFWVANSGNGLFSPETLDFIAEKSSPYVVLNSRRIANHPDYSYKGVIRRLKEINPEQKVIAYTWFLNLHSTEGGYPRIGGWFWDCLHGDITECNSLANEINIESFFLHDENGKRITLSRNPEMYVTNVSNPDYQRTFLEALDIFFRTYPQVDGIAFDGTYYKPNYGSEAYQESVASNVRGFLLQAEQAFPDKIIMFNGLSMNLSPADDNPVPTKDYLEVVDGAQIEFFCHYKGYREGVDFSKYVEPYLQVMQNYPDKIYLVSGRTATYAPFRQEKDLQKYCYAAFLLGKTSNAYFNFTQSFQSSVFTDEHTAGLSYYQNLDMQLGTPLDRYFLQGGVYQRKFQRGLVLVVPDDASEEKSVTILGNYYDSTGEYYSAGTVITLQPGQAKILQKQTLCTQDDCNIVFGEDFEGDLPRYLPFQIDPNDESISLSTSSSSDGRWLQVDKSRADLSKWFQKWHVLKLDRIYREESPTLLTFKIRSEDPQLAIQVRLHADNGTHDTEISAGSQTAIVHFPIITFVPGSNQYVNHPLPKYIAQGMGQIADGGWHTVSLELSERLRSIPQFENYTIHRIDAMAVRGSFEIDNVTLSYQPVCLANDLNCDSVTNLLDLLHWRKAQATGDTATQPTGILGYLQVLRGWLGG